jgi:hypothetical protein
MGRRAKPAKAKVEAKRPPARKSRKHEGSGIHDLEKSLAEALARETATSEILRVIASSPSDVQPVFDAIALAAMRLSGSTIGVVTRYDGEFLHLAAHSHHAFQRLWRWSDEFSRHARVVRSCMVASYSIEPLSTCLMCRRTRSIANQSPRPSVPEAVSAYQCCWTAA